MHSQCGKTNKSQQKQPKIVTVASHAVQNSLERVQKEALGAFALPEGPLGASLGASCGLTWTNKGDHRAPYEAKWRPKGSLERPGAPKRHPRRVQKSTLGGSRNRFKKRSLFGGLWRVKIELSPRRNTHFYKPLERQRASKKRTKMNRKIDTGPAEFNSTRRAGSSGSWRSS